MTDSDSLRGDIDRHTHLPQCCGELETLRALLRPRMADAGDPTPTEALRGMFIEIERLRATTSESTRCQAIEDQLANAIEDRTVAKHALQSLRGRLHELLQLSMDGASDRDIFERIESLKVKLAEERKRTNMLAEQATAERRLASAAAEGHDHARALLVEIAEVFGRVDDFDAIPKMVKDLDDARRAALAKVERLQDRVDEQDKERVIRAAETAAERKRIEGELAIGAEKRDVAAARWTKICEAFGFDHEQDPPISIPAILAGDRWTNTRRMLADACANMRAPSLEVILGELIQTLSKARAPATLPEPLPASVQAPLESPCPTLEEPCHIRKGPEAGPLNISPQIWIIEPVALPGYVISGRNASWMWKSWLGETECALAGYKSATEAIAGARQHSHISKASAPDSHDLTGTESLANDRLTRSSTARCPVCHRMAGVKHGGFVKHMSGDRVCAGTCMLLDLAKAHSQALNVLGWSGADDPVEWAKEARRLADERIDALQAELGIHTATIEAYEMALHTLGWSDEPKAEEWAKTFANSIALRNLEASGSAMQAIMNLGWTEDSGLPVEWSKTTAAHYKAVREALGVPADKPIIPYAQHAAKGMHALAILGWQDGSPVEWATKRAAAEADLRGAFAEAELVGSDHAAMVRHMLGHRRSQSSRLSDALARIYQLEIDHSKVHLEGRIELAEKRVAFFRGWALGMAPSGTSNEISDSELISIIQFVPRADYDAQAVWVDSLAKECAQLRSLVEVMADIKRRLIALKGLSPQT